MTPENIYQLFSPIHLAWLYGGEKFELDMVAADLDSIEANFPEAIHDPLFADYRRRARAGTLRRRPGRKPNSRACWLRLQYASFEIDDEMQAIWARRRSGNHARNRSYLEPCFEAAETVARRMRFGSGWSLYQRLYRLGTRKK